MKFHRCSVVMILMSQVIVPMVASAQSLGSPPEKSSVRRESGIKPEKARENRPPQKSTQDTKRLGERRTDLSSDRSKDTADGGLVTELDVAGNKKIEKDAILRRVKSKVGESFSRDRISEDVAEIFKLGYFYNIEVDRAIKDGAIKLTYIVTEKPSVNEIIYSGQNEVGEDDLKEAIGLKPYEILNLTAIRTAIEKMEKLYEEKGYFLAKIRYRLEDIKSGESVRLVFEIQEGDKVRVKQISFLGNRNLKDDELKGPMITKEEGFFSFLSSSGSYRQEAFDRDVQVLSYLYFNKGYVQAKVNRPQVYVTPDKKSIFITIRVEEGDQFDVGDVDFSGDLLMSKEDLFSAIKIKDNKIFATEVLQGDLQTLQAKYGDLGYAFANIIPRTQIREKERLVDITFEIEKGNKAYFGDITVVGNSKTRDKVLRREMNVREGELYNETRKRESLANIKRLGYFDDVQFNQKTPVDQPDVLNLDVAVKERNTGSIQLGAGYSTFNGFIFNGQVQQSNLFGKGQRLGASLDIGRSVSLFNLNFTEPYVYDTLWSAGFDIYKTQRSLLYNENREGGAVRFGHPLAPNLLGIVRYRNDHTNLEVRPETDPNLFPVETANGRTSSLQTTLEFDRRDDRMMPSDGGFASASLEYAGLGGNNKFTKGFAVGRYYRKLFWNIVSRNNLTYGFISAPEGRQPPFNELFLLGGANNLRGYQWFSIGQKKRDRSDIDRPFGGKQQTIFNTELEFPLIAEAGIRGVLFYDAGQANDEFSFSDTRQDIGFGFRWFSPIGPLRFEWGFPIQRRNDELPVNFEFAIGSPF